MLKEYWSVNDDGTPKELYLLDDEKVQIPDNYFPSWGQEFFYKPKIDFNLKKWVEGRTLEDVLSDLKKNKIDELDRKCNETILGRFIATINGSQYQFSNDQQAQVNFDKILNAFEKGFISELNWTAYDLEGNIVRVPINASSMTDLYVAHLTHIQNNIVKFRDVLQPRIESATTIEQLNSINW